MKYADHPNIVKLYEVYEDSKYLHLVIELCKGQTLLSHLVENGPLTEKEAAVIMKKALSAVNHLHSFDISHRDLKPENFMFSQPDTKSEVKLIDFGFSIKSNVVMQS